MAIISALPYTLVNGQVNDAPQVMSNFNRIRDDVNNNAANSGANSNITSLAGLTTMLTLVDLKRTINAQTGTTYTFVLTDGSQTGGNPMVTFANASPITVTVPANASVAFPVGTQIDCIQDGAGKVTFAAAGGVTINSDSSYLSIANRYRPVSLIKEATNVWYLVGSLTT